MGVHMHVVDLPEESSGGSLWHQVAKVKESFGLLLRRHLELLDVRMEESAKDFRLAFLAGAFSLPFMTAGLVLLSLATTAHLAGVELGGAVSGGEFKEYLAYFGTGFIVLALGFGFLQAKKFEDIGKTLAKARSDLTADLGGDGSGG